MKPTLGRLALSRGMLTPNINAIRHFSNEESDRPRPDSGWFAHIRKRCVDDCAVVVALAARIQGKAV